MADGLKKYMLMHKNIPVADIELDTVSGAVFSVGPAWEAAHVPVGIPVKSGTVDRKAFNEWWRGRSIPASRMGIREALMELKISHVSYSLITEEDYPYSLCEGFITEDTELISAWHLLQTSKKPNHVSLYRHFLDCCNTFGIRGAEDAVNGMLVLDFIIANEDRHLNNFGAVRRADTLEFLGMAPIYDSGTSLWFDKPLPMIHAKANVICKPFKNSHTEQIKLVTDFSWLDFSALKGIDEEFREIIGDSLFIDGTRCSALCRALSGRIEMLEEIVRKGKSRIFVDSTKNDVAENIAYSGSLKHRK